MTTSSFLSRRAAYVAGCIGALAAGGFALSTTGWGVLSERFQPHRVCYLEKPDLIWANVVTDGLIFLAYAAVFWGLIWVASRTRRLLNGTMVAFLVAFGTFILACGLTHVMETVVIWYPFYWIGVVIKGITAIASATTAIAFVVKKGVLVDGITAYQQRLELSELERRQALDALVTADKLATIGRMAASISHEINNPIDAVMNIVYCARTHPELPQDLKQLMDSADAELRHVIEISHSTLAVYRQSAAPTEVDLRDIVRGSMELLQTRALERGITLRTQADGLTAIKATVEAYGGEVRQVVINLVRNAIEASADSGEVRVLIRAAVDEGLGSDGYHLIVEDDGCGIESDFLPKLFRPSTSTKSSGNGIGLWIVRQIIEKHGGTVRVESRTIAPTGTRFVVWLPRMFASGTLERQMRGAQSIAS